MGLRAAWKDRVRQPDGPSGRRALCACAVVVSAAFLTFPAVLSAQRVATGRAVVEVPSVAQLDVESHDPVVEATSSGQETGVFQIRVRANHTWKVVLAAPVGTEAPVWVRVRGEAGTDYRRLDPGSETVVASGQGGERVLEVEYRWEPAASTTVASIPLTYTLASL